MKENYLRLLQKSFLNQMKFNDLLFNDYDWKKNENPFWNRIVYGTVSEIVLLLYKGINNENLLEVKDRLVKAWAFLIGWILQEEHFVARRSLKEIARRILYVYEEDKKALSERITLEDVLNCIDKIVSACARLDLYRAVKDFCQLLLMIKFDLEQLCKYHNSYVEAILTKFQKEMRNDESRKGK